MLRPKTITFPPDILFMFFLFLSPEDIFTFARISKAYQNTSLSNALWEYKYHQHFPHRETTDKPFRDQFIEAYKDEYQLLSIGLRKLFSLVKEGDLISIRAADLPFSILSTRDKNGHSLLWWAQKKKHQTLCNHFFALAVRDFSGMNKKFLPSAHDKHGNTLLDIAIMCNQSLSTIEELIWLGCDISTNLHTGGSHPIHLACIEGRLDIVKRLLQKNPALLNLRDRVGQSPIIHAVPHAHIVRYLAEQGADLTFRTLGSPNRGNTVLLWATELGYADSVKALLDNNADLNVDTGTGPRMKALHIAAAHGHLEIVNIILEKNPHLLDQLDNLEQTPLIWACIENQPHVIRYLIQRGATLSVRSNNNDYYHGYTPLHWAAKYNDLETLQLLLAHKVDVHLSTNVKANFQAIHVASKKGRLEVIKLLLAHEPKLLNALDIFNQTPLIWAISQGHESVVNFLLSKNPDLTLFTHNPGNYHHGFRALHWAAKRGNVRIFNALIKKNGDLTVSADTSQAIHVACAEGNFGVVALILKAKPELLNQTDGHGQTPILWAASTGQTELVEYLAGQGADLTACSNNPTSRHHGFLAIHWAAERGYASTVRVLLEHGAKVNAVTLNGDTALHIAIQSKHIKTIRVLLKHKADINTINAIPEDIRLNIELLTYSRKAKTKPDAKTLLLFSKFGRRETLSAVKALKKVYFDDASADTLAEHKKVLENSDFKTVYKSFRSR